MGQRAYLWLPVWVLHAVVFLALRHRTKAILHCCAIQQTTDGARE